MAWLLADWEAPGPRWKHTLAVLNGRLLGFVLGTIGKRVLEKAFEKSVKAIEARNGVARAARSSGAG